MRPLAPAAPAALFCLLCAPVQAQPAPGLENIVVTATKRATKLEKTPLSITALDSATLRSTDADDFSDFSKLVPGLTDTDLGPGNKRYALRGLQSPGEPEVALYYDEVPIRGLPGGSLDTGASQLDLKLTDINRIEVLRGPEGTLYGNGSEGGAIRIIANRPVLDQFFSQSDLSGSITDGGAPSYRMSQVLNVPILPNVLAVRFAGYYRNEGGWINDVYDPRIALPQIDGKNLNTEETWGGRLSLSWQVSDAWNLTNIAAYQHLATGNSFETYPTFATPSDPYESKAFTRTPWLDKAILENLISSTDLSWADLVVTGSYQERSVDDPTDTTRYLLSLFGCNVFNWNHTCFGPPLVPATGFAFEQVSAWSGEARLVSKGDTRLQWTLGAEFQNARDSRDSQVAKTDAAGYVQFAPDGAALNRLFERTNVDNFDQYSFFGDLGYEFLPGWRATAGLRWFHSYRSDQQVIVQQFFPGDPTGSEPFQSFSQGELFKSFQLSWQATSNVLAFAQASQGFRAGGPNYPGGFTQTAPPYGADSVWDYEVGLKSALYGERVTWNTSLFWINWSNLQLILPAANFSYISNAGAARSQGFESEVSAQLPLGLQAGLGASYADARLVGPQPYESNPQDQLRAGDSLAGVPRWTVNADLILTQKLSDRYTTSERLDFNFQSARSSIVPPQNAAYFVSKPYSLVDLHLRLDRKDGWSLYMDVENLLNAYAELSVQADDGNLVETITPARPLTVRLGVSKKFF